MAGGVLAIVDQHETLQPWSGGVLAAIQRWSTNLHFQPYDLIEELVVRNLFRPRDRRETAPLRYTRPIVAYVESFHARNGLSRDRMTLRAAATFDREMIALVAPHANDGLVTLTVTAEVVWGLPVPR